MSDDFFGGQRPHLSPLVPMTQGVSVATLLSSNIIGTKALSEEALGSSSPGESDALRLSDWEIASGGEQTNYRKYILHSLSYTAPLGVFCTYS